MDDNDSEYFEWYERGVPRRSEDLKSLLHEHKFYIHNEHKFCRHDSLDSMSLARIDSDRNEYDLRRKDAHIRAGKDIDKAKTHIDDLCKALRFTGGHVESFRKLLDYTKHFVSISWTEFDYRPHERQCRAVSNYAINALESLTIS